MSTLHLRLPGCRALVAVWILFTSILAAGDMPGFRPGQTAGEFRFDTGVLTGTLRPEGKSLGLVQVIHRPTGARLDRSNGLLSHYRVFSVGTRYGGGAWDFPSEARLASDGTVEVRWGSATDRPFELGARYRLAAEDTVDCVTWVKAATDLRGFEVFLASYFDAGFTNALVRVQADGRSNADDAGFATASPEFGEWQIFPRDAAAAGIVQDGRWTLEPHPVAWRLRSRFNGPLALRRNPATGLAAALMAPANDCFAVATPHQSEGHYSTYLSLFGRDLKAGESVRAHARLQVGQNVVPTKLVNQHANYVRALETSR